jgi:hypothetical protein
MRDFVIRTDERTAVFRFGSEFTQSNGRLCWTEIGLEKLIDLGLWQREMDASGNLKAKPLRVEQAMSLPSARPLIIGTQRRVILD